MSMLGSKTKKVNVYGRKKATIINIHQDVVSPVKSSDASADGTPVPSTPWKRPPLSSKLSQNTVTVESSSEEDEDEPVKAKAKGKPAVAGTAKAKEPLGRKVYKTAKPAVVPPSPSAYAPTPARSVIDCVEIPSARAHGRAPRPRRKAVRPPIREDDDLDELTLRLEKTSIGATGKSSSSNTLSKKIIDLCALCGQQAPESWESFFAGAAGKLSKVGEASYSEVFGLQRIGGQSSVLKVIPLAGTPVNAPEGKTPDCSTVEEVAREIEITKRIAEVPGGGFVNFIKASVVEGEYPEALLEKWDVYKKKHGTYSSRPNCFTAKQKYCVVELVNHGIDLDNFEFSDSLGWTQALGVVCQVADALSRAESFTRFEHRDLHESQILLSAVPKSSDSDHASPSTSGLEATLIDFGLSRLDIPGKKTAWSLLPDEVFEGKGDQWDVYRKMRDLTKDAWAGEHLITNVLWLQYLVNYLFSRSDLRKPKSKPGKSSTPDAAANENAYGALLQILEALDRSVDVASTLAAGREVRARRGKEEYKSESAQDVVVWLRGMTWVA